MSNRPGHGQPNFQNPRVQANVPILGQKPKEPFEGGELSYAIAEGQLPDGTTKKYIFPEVAIRMVAPPVVQAIAEAVVMLLKGQKIGDPAGDEVEI